VLNGLEAFDHGLDARCDAGTLPEPTCKRLNQLLVPAWDAYLAGNAALQDGDPSKLGAAFTAIDALMREVEGLVATPEVRTALLSALARAKLTIGARR
jgi:hypothetical protein